MMGLDGGVRWQGRVGGDGGSRGKDGRFFFFN